MTSQMHLAARAAFFMFVLCLCGSCGVFRAAWYLQPDMDDYRHDPQRTVAPPAEAFHFFEKNNGGNPGESLRIFYRFVQQTQPLDEFVKRHGTRAFLVIRNDTVLYERYPNGHAPDLPVTTFSVSKAVMTTLVGRAIHLGYLRSVEQPICEVLPEWESRGFGEVTVRDLLMHTSGIAFSTSLLNLNCDQVQFYYGKNLRRRMASRRLEHPPGTHFNYHSANTQLLGMMLERATGLTLSQCLENWLWQPLGMEGPASWSLDRRGKAGTERAFCCLQARALDFAKLGRLWLHNGHWQGQQLLPPGWLDEVVGNAHPSAGPYRCGFTTKGSCSNQAFFTSGFMGQVIYVVPEKNLLILRFGEHRKGYSVNLWSDVMAQVAEGF